MGLTIKKFMMFDLLVLTVMAIIADVLGYFASRQAFAFLYIALSIPVMLIAYIRWDIKALIIPVLIMVLHLILYRGGTFLAQSIYVLSILSTALSMIWFKFIRRDGIKDEFILLSTYYLTAYIALFMFHVLAMAVSGEIQWVTLIIRHSVNVILGWLILFIASKQQDLLVDMKAYLKRQIEERRQEEGRY